MGVIIWLLPHTTMAQSTEQDDYSRYDAQIAFPTSPTAASLGEYGKYPVNLQNGLIDISIPLYTIKTQELTLPISLSYHASGIKVDEEASWVGLGWALNAGGVITKSTKGAPDESGYGFNLYYNDVPDASDIDLTTESDFEFVRNCFKGTFDREPDIYNYNFGGYSGQFVLGNDGEYHTMGLDNLKIQSSGLFAITVTAPDGRMYRFGMGTDGREAYEQTVIQPPNLSYTGLNQSVTAWYLTEIISSDRSDTIYFRYNSHLASSYNLGSQYQSYITEVDGVNPPPIGTQEYGWNATVASIGNSRQLSEIDFSNGKVLFNAIDDRQDSPITRLVNFQVFNKSSEDNAFHELKTINFLNDAYFDRSWHWHVVETYSSTGVEEKSLKLTGVDIVSPTQSQKSYRFEYNSTNLPARKTTAQDYWGYYNGVLTNDNLIPEVTLAHTSTTIGTANREPDAASMQACILKSITYPTGGRTEFTYEPNYYVSQSTYDGGQTKVISIVKNVMAVGHVSDPSLNIETKLVDEISFTPPLDGMTTLTYEFTTTYGVQYDNYPRLTLVDSVSDEVLFSELQHITDQPLNGTVQIYLRAGRTYHLRAETCDCTSPNSIIGAAYVSGTISYDDNIIVTDPQEWIPEMAGGLRIKKIENFDANSTVPSATKSYVYGDIQVSGNIGIGYLVSPNIDTHTKNLYLNHNESSLNNPSGSNDYTAILFYVNSNSYIDWGYNGNSPVEYGKVTEYSGTPFDNVGKTEYYFTRTEEIVGFFGNQYFPYDYLLYPKYKSGRLSEERKYRNDDDSYVLQQKNLYRYETKKGISVKAFKVLQKVYFSSASWDGASVTWPERYIPENYVLQLGNYKLKSTTTETYDESGAEPVVTTKYMKYDPVYFQLTSDSTVNSNGDIISGKYWYPYQDGELTGLTSAAVTALDQMVMNHQISDIVDQKDYKHGQLDTWLRKNYEMQTDGTVLLNNVEKSYLGNSLESQLAIDQYDDRKNVVQFTDQKRGITTSILYGYNQTLPVLYAKNLDYSTFSTALNSVLNSLGYNSIDALLQAVGKLYTSNEKLALKNFISALLNSSTIAGNDILVSFYTYEPLVGITSMTDPNGQTTYYNYDSFGRLESTRDSKGNIVQHYKYHYAQQ
ncbi:RHS repeat protein [Prolixibacter bellariivorans]|nr:RHS repeat domain-containing protein [Prolixibacter bellariivorans]